MPLVIGRNTLSYTGDTSEQQVSYHNAEDIYIADGVEQPLAPPISLSISDKCHHVRIQGNLKINVAFADMPRVLVKVTSATGTQAWHTTVYDGSPNNATIDSSTSDPEPISEVSICLMSKAGQPFTLPANSKIHLCVRGCDAVMAGPHAVTGPAVPPPPTAHAFTAYQIMYNIVFSGRYEYIGPAVMSARDNHTVTGWLTGSDPLVRASDGVASDYGVYLRTDGHYALVFYTRGWGGDWTHVYPGDATGGQGSNLDGTPFTTLESVIQAGTLTSKWGFSDQTQQFVTSASDNTPYKKLPAGQSNNDTTVTEVAPGVVG